MMKVRTTLLMAGIVSLILAACAGTAETQPTEQPVEPTEVIAPSIVEIAVEDGRFETLVAALQASGLDQSLEGDGPFTVFAPTDDAFAKLPDGTVEALLGDIPQLTDILLYHVVSGELFATDVSGMDGMETLLGEPLSIEVEGDLVRINEAQVVIADIQASNGVIHVIDRVLLPAAKSAEATSMNIVELAAEDGRFSTLVAALQAAGLDQALSGEGPFTVFAPTDDAFAQLPEGTVASLLEDIPALTNVLTYHVVNGQVLAEDVAGLSNAETLLGQFLEISADRSLVTVDGAEVVTPDLLASNGVIHVIDRVLLPETRNIVEIATEDGRFTTLVAALQAAGLDETLAGEGSFTVFAPTDDAFAQLPDGTVEALLGDLPQLTDILLYHVVAGKVMSQEVITLENALTLQGGSIMIFVGDDSVQLNDAGLLATDIEATNGVIHVIGSVLLPPV
jgi:transforming growth factor-beta-induced protein